MFRRIFFGLAALAGVAFASSANATLIFNLSEFSGGTPATGTITVDQFGNDLQFSVQVTSPDFADIRGVFFNVADDSLLGGLSASGADVTGFEVNPSPGGGGISNDALVEPLSFDFGVEIGTAGIGSDDIYSTIFTISHDSLALDLNTFFESGDDVVGLRLTSVGSSQTNRGGSSKLSGDFPNGEPPTQVPEPGMLLLLGAGLFALGMVRRMRAA